MKRKSDKDGTPGATSSDAKKLTGKKPRISNKGKAKDLEVQNEWSEYFKSVSTIRAVTAEVSESDDLF